MLKNRPTSCPVMLVALMFALVSASITAAPDPGGGANSRYAYHYSGEMIKLQPSETLFAIRDDPKGVRAFSAATDGVRDPLGDNPAAREHAIVLYRGTALNSDSADAATATPRLAAVMYQDVTVSESTLDESECWLGTESRLGQRLSDDQSTEARMTHRRCLALT